MDCLCPGMTEGTLLPSTGGVAFTALPIGLEPAMIPGPYPQQPLFVFTPPGIISQSRTSNEQTRSGSSLFLTA